MTGGAIDARRLGLLTQALEGWRRGFDGPDAAAGEPSPDPGRQALRGALLAAGFETALQENLQLWAELRRDLAAPATTLPPDLCAALVAIADWVERHTALVLDRRARVAPLLEVNRHILDGLRERPAPPPDMKAG